MIDIMIYTLSVKLSNTAAAPLLLSSNILMSSSSFKPSCATQSAINSI